MIHVIPEADWSAVESEGSVEWSKDGSSRSCQVEFIGFVGGNSIASSRGELFPPNDLPSHYYKSVTLPE